MTHVSPGKFEGEMLCNASLDTDRVWLPGQVALSNRLAAYNRA